MYKNFDSRRKNNEVLMNKNASRKSNRVIYPRFGFAVSSFFTQITIVMATSTPVSNWNHWVSEMQYSPQEFFQIITQTMENQGLSEIKTSLVQHGRGQYGIREYLRVSHRKTHIDIGAAPYGNGFFISYWVSKTESRSPLSQFCMVLANLFRRIPLPFIPQVGYSIFSSAARSFQKRHDSVYVLDDTFMFQQAVHRSITLVISNISSTQGKRQMPEFISSPSTFQTAFE